MSHATEEKTVPRGGLIVLVASVAIALTWSVAEETWTILIVQWMIAAAAWIALLRIKRWTTVRETLAASLLTALLGATVWGIGVWTVGLADLVRRADDRSLVLCLGIACLTAIAVAAWLLAAALPASVRSSAGRPIRALLEAGRTVGRSRSVWSFSWFSGAAYLIAGTVGGEGNLAVGIACGLASAYVQLALQAAVLREARAAFRGEGARPVPGRARGRRIFLAAFLVGHFCYYLFYVVLFSVTGQPYSFSWAEAALTYPAAWAFGGFYALFAWLAGKIRFLYYGVLLVLVLANGLLFGLLFSLFGETIVS